MGQTSADRDSLISVVLVDDHEMLLQGVALALDAHDDIEVLATATTRRTGLQRFMAVEPDVLVVDYRIGADSGADLARDVVQRDPTANVIAISALDTDAVLDDVIDAGCVGFVDKRNGVDALANAVRVVNSGSMLLPRRAIEGRPTTCDPSDMGLTLREVEVLERLGRGASASEIAGELHVSVHTVRNHTRELRRKLGVQTQLAAVIEGIRLGLIPSPGLR